MFCLEYILCDRLYFCLTRDFSGNPFPADAGESVCSTGFDEINSYQSFSFLLVDLSSRKLNPVLQSAFVSVAYADSFQIGFVD